MYRSEQPASNSASPPKPQVEIIGTLGGPSVAVHVEALFAVFASGVVDTTVAVLASGPGELGVATTSMIVAEPPLANVPTEQTTAPVKEQDPCVGVAETNVVPAGRMSVTVTPAAEMGPAFATARL